MTPYWFKPDHQPRPEEPVEFEIRPLNLAACYEVQTSLTPAGAVSTACVQEIFKANVVNWRGIPEPHSGAAKRRILETTGPLFGFQLSDWMIWTGHIAQHAYLQAILPEDERKNS